ncbi:MAG TPA: methyltransferase domain-containing protein [Myxococcaceae bacterium]|nr:methyltransferase domain-containing protein [Myxococcaceae bacterium]
MTRGPRLRSETAGGEFLTLLTPPDWMAVFGGPGPLELEIGSGAGAFALGVAARYPERRYVAIEWRKKYARELEHRARSRGLSNLKVVEADARAVIPRLFAPGSLSAIHLQFPDPWWKRAHRKRAILTPGFARLLLQLAAPGAVFDLRTDVRARADEMLETLEAAGWHNALGAGAFHPPDPDELPSSRERRYLENGEPVYRARLLKRSTTAR